MSNEILNTDISGAFAEIMDNESGRYTTKSGVITTISLQSRWFLQSENLTVHQLADNYVRETNAANNSSQLFATEKAKVAALMKNGTTIGKAFWELCKRNGISEAEFEDFIAELNADLDYMEISRTKEYEVTVTWRPEIQFTYTVNAADEDEASAKAIEMFEISDIRTFDWYSEDDLDTEVDEA